ncbi:MAG TPA: GNAT family N-acetyltransferase [Acidimicrobiia bacterium]|nr:GNAT family N-acetyltransferase [Acidimicrobiia bacterium]
MSALVAPITDADCAEVLPLVAAYQRFYEVEPDEARNATFFRRFVASGSSAAPTAGESAPGAQGELPGVLLGARVDGTGPLVGYACLHWRLDTVAAKEVVCLHDLYAVPEVRGTGVGRALLEAAAEVARARGAASLVWSTAPGNATAQRLYDATGATRSTWVEYELPV